MFVVFDTLNSKLEQRIDCTSTGRVQIAAIIPYLLVYNCQSGVFKFSVLKDSTEIFSKEFNLQDLKGNVTENFAHIYYPLVPGNPLPFEEGEYIFRLETVSDYAATGNEFIGWIKQHEDEQLPMAYIPLGDGRKTYTIRFKEYKGIHQ